MLQPINRTGDTFTGGGSVRGDVHNLRAAQGQGDSAVIQFALDCPNPDSIGAVVYLNGRAVKVLPATETQTTLSNLGFDAVRIEVVPEPLGFAPIRIGDYNDGRNAALRWPRSTDPDVIGYRVYWADLGLGTPDDLLVTVSDPVVENKIAEPSGGGTGLIQFFGSFQGVPCNAPLEVEITGAGTATYHFLGESVDIEFTEGEEVVLEQGAIAKFLNPVSTYEAGATYSTWIGPAAEYESVPLLEGVYEFAVRAIDAYGNQSDPIYSQGVSIVYGPNSVTNSSISFVDGDILLTWQAPADGDLAAVELYTNLNPETGRLDTYISDFPYATFAPSITEYTIDPGAETGNFIFFLRTRDTSGRSDNSIEALTIAMPYIPADLGEPLKIEFDFPAPETVRIKWDYRFNDSDPVTNFRVKSSLTDTIDDWPEKSWTYAATPPSDGTGVGHYSHTVSPGAGYVGTVYFRLVAEDATGYQNPATEILHSVEVDFTPPTLSGTVNGLPN